MSLHVCILLLYVAAFEYCYAIGLMVSTSYAHCFTQGLVYDDMMLASALWRLVLVRTEISA